MQASEALRDAFGRIRDFLHGTVGDLDGEALVWRPDPQANSIAWLVWHLTRIQDDHIADLAGHEQTWTADGWAEHFGLPADSMDTGFGHSPEHVAAIDPEGPGVLLEYQDRVADRTRRYLRELNSDDFDRVIDRSFDPPVTVGVRLISVIGDALQHTGQAAYVRGLYERRTSPRLAGDGD